MTNTAVLAAVPRDFREAAARAAKQEDAAQLLLMAGEVSAKPWRIQALGLLGLALFNLKADKAAIVTYERIRHERPDDPEANLRLATLFERNGDTASSDAALRPLRAPTEPVGLVLLATGHRADAPGRTPPRLPSNAETQRRLKATLARHITEAKQGVQGSVRGLAALASGTDIVFHEVCAELGLQVDAYLPLPADAFKAESVADGGLDWMKRFDERRSAARRVYELGSSKEPPSWVDDPNYGVFQRGNLWMLDAAFGARNANVVLLAVWDGEAARGPGGTADMVHAAKSRGANVRVIDPQQLDLS